MIRTIALLLLSSLPSLAADYMKAFPAAEEGMTRHVLKLPEAEKEDGMKVEIIVGKTVRTDEINRHFLSGKIEEENIEGWGFTRYVVRKVGPMVGTLMGIPPGTPQVDTFVSLGGGPFLVRYNSKLPLVVYVPDGCEVRYKIWRSDSEAKPVDRG